MSDATIKIRNNGPYLVSGPVRLTDADGNVVAVDRDTFALCRCGGSLTKPFCDGTHSTIGFQGAMAAVEKTGDG